MLGSALRDEQIRQHDVVDVMHQRIASLKRNFSGHVARMTDERWIVKTLGTADDTTKATRTMEKFDQANNGEELKTNGNGSFRVEEERRGL